MSTRSTRAIEANAFAAAEVAGDHSLDAEVLERLRAESRKGLSVAQRPDWLVAIADPVRLQIVQTLSLVVDATAADLAAINQVSDQTLRRHLDALQASRVIQVRPGESDGERPGRPPARFSLSPEVRESVCAVFDTTD